MCARNPTDEDALEYECAIGTLMDAARSGTMLQRTPAAVEDDGRERGRYKRKMPDYFEEEEEEEDCSSSSSCCSRRRRKRMRSKKRARYVIKIPWPSPVKKEEEEEEKKKKKRKEEEEEKKKEEEEEEEWAEMLERERSSPYPIVPDYPDRLGALHPGSRRRAANVMHMMAHVLNLELCTAGFAVLTFDRYFSNRRRSSEEEDENSAMLMAMVCLNVAGKVADLDSGHCGSKAVISMLREASPARVHKKTRSAFARHVGKLERDVLETLNGTLLSHPSAMQIISEITGWDASDPPMWLRAGFVCDVFSADTTSTRFSQTQIARSVVELCRSADYDDDDDDDSNAIACSLRAFFGSERSCMGDSSRDPYFGVRIRHLTNPQMARMRVKMMKILQ